MHGVWSRFRSDYHFEGPAASPLRGAARLTRERRGLLGTLYMQKTVIFRGSLPRAEPWRGGAGPRRPS